MSSKARLFLLCVLLLNPLIGEETDTVQDDWQAVHYGRIALQLPADWQAGATISPRIGLWRSPRLVPRPTDESDLDLRDAFLQAEAARAAVSIHSEELAADSDLAAYAEERRAQFLDLGSEPEILVNEAIELHGHTWQGWTVRFTVGTVRWQQRWLMTQLQSPEPEDPDLISAVVFATSEDAWHTWHPLFATLEQGLQVVPLTQSR